MDLNLIDTYSLCITISFELNDVSIPLDYQKRGENNGDNCALAGDILSKHINDINDC
ncbi:hypothetical protein [uncultured Methanobrevibacter sp.]|uniref:hypothetical protein n=1 Tax=uncultured Methanobrevibacter sp. TaxID=253161 RepID=UPI0026249B79|nr:hypothetical protein [uncultured Methanobrevibacter sp.]